MPPEILTSTREEHEQYIKENYYCRSNCDICGMCKVFHGKTPEVVFGDYIEGLIPFQDIMNEYRQ